MTYSPEHIDQRIFESRILTVDDHEANNRLLAQLLRRDGFSKIQVCGDPREVATLLPDFDPDIILLDLHMPEMDGFQVLEVIRHYSAGHFLPVLVLTADTTSATLHRALAAGASDYLVKPLDAPTVSLRMRNLLVTRLIYQDLRRQNARLRAHVDVLENVQARHTEAYDVRRSRIERILDENQPNILFQPIVDLERQVTVGYEALARFDVAPARGPDHWFNEAFDVGLGIELELTTIQKVMNLVGQIDEELFVSINVSPETAMTDLLAQLGTGAPWERLVIELTEHFEIEDYTNVNGILQPLRSAGAGIAVDDTGSGFASFRHILNLAPDYVKLDITLCRGVDEDPARQALASALVSFTNNTQALIIAEGIETEGEFATLKGFGVELGQGYFFGRPAPLDSPTS